MRKNILIIMIASFICLSLAACAPSVNEKTPDKDSQTETSQKQQVAPPPAKTEECLSCHPYDEVMAKSANYIDPSLGPVNPHRLIDENAEKFPHKSENGTPMDCADCHTSHTISSSGTVDNVELPKSIDSCYASCHHNRNFDACSGCHTDKY